VIESPMFHSSGDERAFFYWIAAIACVEEVKGRGTQLSLSFRKPPNNAELRELIGLFARYEIDMGVLAQFRTSRNAAWFADDPAAFWHRRVFGSS
jgi:hypothetical protein